MIYSTIGNATIYCGDSTQIGDIKADCVATDPPYGIKNDCNYERFKGKIPGRNHHLGIKGDDTPFDPSWLLKYKQVCLFGFQFFADRLPVGSVIVWNWEHFVLIASLLGSTQVWVYTCSITFGMVLTENQNVVWLQLRQGYTMLDVRLFLSITQSLMIDCRRLTS